MPLFACTRCGKTSDQRQCPAHRRPKNASWSQNRDRSRQARFRTQVLDQAGHRCQYVDGIARCPVHGDRNLQAHHLEPGNDDPTKGLALCRAHHRTVDSHAR